MPKPRITIVGLGLIGSSIGLALSREQRDFEIIGHDKSSAAAGQAKKLQAVDKTEWNLISACDGAGLVILALPLGAIRETMQAVAGELAEGAVVMDTASVKAPVQAWADELLPSNVPFVGTNPIVGSDATGDITARADLFEGRLWAICPSPSTDERGSEDRFRSGPAAGGRSPLPGCHGARWPRSRGGTVACAGQHGHTDQRSQPASMARDAQAGRRAIRSWCSRRAPQLRAGCARA